MKRLFQRFPVRFFRFCIIGFLGLFVYLITFGALRGALQLEGDWTLFRFSIAVLVSIEVGMVTTFLGNHYWTFADRKLSGSNIIYGFCRYNVVCWIGGAANYCAALILFLLGFSDFLCAFGGAVVGAFWNYFMNVCFTWKKDSASCCIEGKGL